jgi:hypothetical protein
VVLGFSNDTGFTEMLALRHDDLVLQAVIGMAWGDEAKGIDLENLYVRSGSRVPVAAARVTWVERPLSRPPSRAAAGKTSACKSRL